MLKSIGESGHHPCRTLLPITLVPNISLLFLFLLSGPCESPVFPVHSYSSQCIHEFLPVYSIESLFVIYRFRWMHAPTSLIDPTTLRPLPSCALSLSETILTFSYTVISFSS